MLEFYLPIWLNSVKNIFPNYTVNSFSVTRNKKGSVNTKGISNPSLEQFCVISDDVAKDKVFYFVYILVSAMIPLGLILNN
jgi:hypothetical protein